MADIKFIESLNIEDNIFELKENCIIGYLVHYCAPFTGGGEHEVPAGIRFCLHGPMRDDAMYMHMIDRDNHRHTGRKSCAEVSARCDGSRV